MKCTMPTVLTEELAARNRVLKQEQNVFSMVPVKHQVKLEVVEALPCKKTTLIHDLPADVLIIIFKHVHRMQAIASIPEDEDDTTHIYSRTAFPEAVAAVCPFWREVMSTVSLFWTHLVIFVDKIPTPLSVVHTYLSWSAEHALDIYVARRPAYSSNLVQENKRFKLVLALLLDHIERWRSLRLDGLPGQPILSMLLCRRYAAKQLYKLYICPDAQSTVDSSMQRPAQIVTPRLLIARLDDWILSQAYLRSPASLSSVRTLVLAHDPSAPPLDLSVQELLLYLRELPHLLRLHLINICPVCSDVDEPVSNFFLWDVTFEDMDADVIAAFYEAWGPAGPDYAEFVRCSLPEQVYPSMSRGLKFKSISADEDLAGFLNGFAGTDCKSLVFHDCPGFDARVLEAMSRPENGFWLCPNLSLLKIIRCGDFSGADLRSLVYQRTCAHSRSGMVDSSHPRFTVTSIESVTVGGYTSFPTQDKQWLQSYLKGHAYFLEQ